LTHADTLATRIHNSEQAREVLLDPQAENFIVYGKGRSYGDVALNSKGSTVLSGEFSAHKEFDPQTGILICDPGVTFHDLIQEYLPTGFIAPVTPGTGYATIGGAIANDVHGKNHDMAGSFGDHVIWLDLLLPDGEIKRLSREDSTSELLAATIGGIGLTGIILKVCFKMQRVPGNAVVVHEQRINNLDHFFDSFKQARDISTYSVGWIDALAKGRNLGRGILETAELSADTLPTASQNKNHRVPFDFPNFTLNSTSIRLFNTMYYHRVPSEGRERQILLEKFLYPLDSLLEWNRIYGKRGFYQFQCVIPDEYSYEGIRELLETISNSGSGSFLAVLKTLGDAGTGYLSFPMRGYTLALDFPNKEKVASLLAQLETITLKFNGRIYLAKDACLSAHGFARMYPRLEQFRQILNTIDPLQRMNSDMARRLMIR